jgi:Hsp90 protein/Protein of unknown function (DUF5672)/Histidine kinase-, DNA gyrase B-, and HSP90-like ATPase
MIRLPEVTLLGIDCINIKRLVMAAQICQRKIKFGKVALLSSIVSSNKDTIRIPHIGTSEDYSKFMIKNVHEYVQTDYVLIIQWDGFILNPDAWDDTFLQYDYIGAPWDFTDRYNVGNGGFSLRSKRLLSILSHDKHITNFHPEDLQIGRAYREYLEAKGVRFAPDSIAARFSIEGNKRYGYKWNNEFGFHSYLLTDISNWKRSENAEFIAKVEELQIRVAHQKFIELIKSSLYGEKEIFLRELISNASDALDMLQFEASINPELLQEITEYAICLEINKESRTLSVIDNGIGMSREEIMTNIGAVVKLGVDELWDKFRNGYSLQMIVELISQAGIGFYSSFMVADKVTVVTRKAGDDIGTMWESIGDGTYIVSEVERLCQGTTVTLHLKDVDLDNGIEDYTNQLVLSRIIKRRSDFISYQIICKYTYDKIDQCKSQELNIGSDFTVSTVSEKLNSMNPVWRLVPSEITDCIYSEYYRHISHDWAKPFKTISLMTEEAWECQALLYIPSKAHHDVVRLTSKDGLRLYVKGVIVMGCCEELLPGYLRFIKGVVNFEYLPGNISLQTLQHSQHIVRIRKWLTNRVLDALEELFEKEYNKYLQFLEQFGWVLEEGALSDHENKGRILSLLNTSLDKDRATHK